MEVKVSVTFSPPPPPPLEPPSLLSCVPDPHAASSAATAATRKAAPTRRARAPACVDQLTMTLSSRCASVPVEAIRPSTAWQPRTAFAPWKNPRECVCRHGLGLLPGANDAGRTYSRPRSAGGPSYVREDGP